MPPAWAVKEPKVEPDGDNDGEFEGSSSSTTSPEELPVGETTPSPLPDQEPVTEASSTVGFTFVVEKASSSNAQEAQSSSQPKKPAVRYTSVEDLRENILREGMRLTDAEYNSVIEGLAPGSERYKLKQQRDGENRWPTAK